MAVFKIMLIILIALPVVAFSVYLYFQVLGFIHAKNSEAKYREEQDRRLR